MSKDKDNVIPFPGTKLPTKDKIDKLNDELLMQKEEVEMMIKKYIKSEMSLIIVVRKADDDDENVEALRIAKEVDETFSRTLEVITHCDRMKE